MKTRSLKQERNVLLILVITLTISIIFFQCKGSYTIELKHAIGTIEGKIENYDGVYKSGKLSYYDAISRMVQSEIFAIDSTGSFKVTFNISHPIYNATYLDLQGHLLHLFLEPGKNLKIRITGNSIDYMGDNGLFNNQIKLLEDTIDKKFQKEIKRCMFLHTTNIGYQDYLKEQINLAKMKLKFIKEFEKTHNFSKEVLNAVKKEAYYAPARLWINFRYDYSNGPPERRDTLFKNFYEDLFKTYPINDRNAMVSAEYIGYISNIQEVFSKLESYDSLISFIKISNSFSNEDLILIKRVYNSDTSVYNSKEFKQFNNENNSKKLTELSNRFRVRKMLTSCEEMPRGIGRDLIISQGLCSYYFASPYLQPTENEWKRIKELIETKFILDYLLDLDNKIKVETPVDKASKEIPETVKKLATDLNTNLIGKYKGKVVYIDFWATWCGPCRNEIPYSKVLMEQFKDKDVVFLSLCCKSNERDWKNTIALEKLQGEHYLVSDIEYDLLSAIYGVNSFPTYILIDKNGKVVNNKAPRPSSNKIIINEIQNLLE